MPTLASVQSGTVISSAAEVIPVSGKVADLCGTEPGAWSADDLAVYIREEIGRLHGPQLPRSGESRILAEYHARFGADGVRVARHAFEARKGMWRGAPITIARFSPAHDDFFSHVILKELIP